MKYSLLFLFLTLFTIFSYSQENDSINILFNSEWKISEQGLHPQQNILKLTRYKRKEDSINSQKLKDSIIKAGKLDSKTIARLKKSKYRNYYGEFLIFDSISNANFHLRSWCITGATVYKIKEFKFHKNKILIHYNKRIISSNLPQTEHKYWYKIIVWNEKSIILERQIKK